MQGAGKHTSLLVSEFCLPQRGLARQQPCKPISTYQVCQAAGLAPFALSTMPLPLNPTLPSVSLLSPNFSQVKQACPASPCQSCGKPPPHHCMRLLQLDCPLKQAACSAGCLSCIPRALGGGGAITTICRMDRPSALLASRPATASGQGGARCFPWWQSGDA